jgi:predicted HicB family RNase H-like nuclease
MSDSAQPSGSLELRLPRPMLDDLASAASSQGKGVDALVVEWLRERLIHEREKQEGHAHQVRRS